MVAMYMVTTNWRGSLHIDPMRLFPTLEKSVHYSKGLDGGTVKIYLLSSCASPMLIKPKDYEHWI